MKKCRTVAAALLVACASILSAKSNSVLILPFESGEGVSVNSKAITEIFTSEYSATAKLSSISKKDYESKKTSLRFNDYDLNNNTDNLKTIAKALDASQVLVGKLMSMDDGLVANAKVIDVESGVVLASSTEICNNSKQLIAKIPSMCKELASNTAVSQVSGYKVGEEGPGGGIVVYASAKGFNVYDEEGNADVYHYIEMSKTSIGQSAWFPENTRIDTQNGIGYGKVNTQKILNCDTTKTITRESCAAYECSFYATPSTKAGDWYLPSSDEMNLIYENFKDRIVSYTSEPHFLWTSSSNGDTKKAGIQSFENVRINKCEQTVCNQIWAIRYF